MCQTVLREGSLVRDFRLSGNQIRQWFCTFITRGHVFVFLLISTTVCHLHNPCACWYNAHSTPTDPGWNATYWMTQSSDPMLTCPPFTRQTLTRIDNMFVWCLKWPVSMVKPVNVGRWHHSAWVEETSDGCASPVICFPVDKRSNMW